MTLGASDVLDMTTLELLLDRHTNGDWGDVPAETKAANEHAVLNGGQIRSRYPASGGRCLWVITDTDLRETRFALDAEATTTSPA